MANTSREVSLILRRFAATSQAEVARLTGVDNTLLSKFLSGERGLRLDQIGPVLAALGLSIAENVTGDLVTVTREKYEALRLLAAEELMREARTK